MICAIGTGIIFYTKYFEEIPYKYAARCTCKNAMQYSSKIPSVLEVKLEEKENKLEKEGGEE